MRKETKREIEGKIMVLTTNMGEMPSVKGMVRYAKENSQIEPGEREEFQWFAAMQRDGKYEILQGEHADTMILLKEHVGKYLKCEWKKISENGSIVKWTVSEASVYAVKDVPGNPLTEWMAEAGFGVSHHVPSDFMNLDYVAADETEKWDEKTKTWNEYWEQFDVEKYAVQINNIGAKYVIWTLGQNSGYYCAPNPVYDDYLRQAGLLEEGMENPKTVSMENDIPMKVAGELKKYGIKVILYLPSNPPHSAHWKDEDFEVTKKVFDYTPKQDTPATQKGKHVLIELVKWWSCHYGEKIAGWWFDGCFPGGILESQTDTTLYYNLSTLANAAKAGNPYGIVSFNAGLEGNIMGKTNCYQDYSCGETQEFMEVLAGENDMQGEEDCQKFLWGPMGKKDNAMCGWGCRGLSRPQKYWDDVKARAKEKKIVLCLDVRINIFGELDSEQYATLLKSR